MTLAYLYQKQGDRENAKKYAAAAQSLASLRGDSLAQVQLEKLSDRAGSDGSGSRGLVGDKVPLPEGGKSFEDAAPISPGLYISTRDLATGVYQYFKVHLRLRRILKRSGEQNNGGAL